MANAGKNNYTLIILEKCRGIEPVSMKYPCRPDGCAMFRENMHFIILFDQHDTATPVFSVFFGRGYNIIPAESSAGLGKIYIIGGKD